MESRVSYVKSSSQTSGVANRSPSHRASGPGRRNPASKIVSKYLEGFASTTSA
jgi:hypothetical protein